MLYYAKNKVAGVKIAWLAILTGAIIFSAMASFRSYHLVASYYKPYYFKSHLAATLYSARNIMANSAAVIATNTPGKEAGSVPVLLYHGILKESDGINLDLDHFVDHMMTLKKAGYETVTIDDFYAFLTGKKSLPERSFLLTFDDGRKDSFYPANPILKALDYNAVMFAVANPSEEDDNNYYLTKDELEALIQTGRWQIESHTKTHRDLSDIQSSELEDEIGGSKVALERIFGKPIIAFAFPFGELGHGNLTESQMESESALSVITLAKRYYLMSFFQFLTTERYTHNYPNPAGSRENYMVKRISVPADWSGEDLLTVMESGKAKTLPFNAALTKEDGWINTLWGKISFSKDGVEIGALADSTGSAIILDGSRKWRDYEINAEVVWRNGSNVYLWARYQNDNNYVACNFGNGLAHIEETLDGKTSVIKGEAFTISESERQDTLRLGMSVRGRSVSCLVNGEEAVGTDFLSASLQSGGIGMKVWDKMAGKSDLNITKLIVTPLD